MGSTRGSGGPHFPTAPPLRFGFILLASNLKVVSKVDLFGACLMKGASVGGDRAGDLGSWAGLGLGGGACWGPGGRRPGPQSIGPGFAEALLASFRKALLNGAFPPRLKSRLFEP